jgi:DNA-binding PadR family transcriptional regulator
VTEGKPADMGRLEEPSLLVLISLSGGPKHGYAIQTDVQAFAGATIGPGTMYAVLPRLERLGLIEALPPEDRKRPYRLTGEGAAWLRRELGRRNALATLGLDRLRTER